MFHHELLITEQNPPACNITVIRQGDFIHKKISLPISSGIIDFL